MKTMKMAIALALLAACNVGALAQTGKPSSMVLLVETNAAQSEHEPDKRTVPLDAQRERQALRIFLKSVQDQIVSAAEAMPATKYEFTPTEGEFKGVTYFRPSGKAPFSDQPYFGSRRSGRGASG